MCTWSATLVRILPTDGPHGCTSAGPHFTNGLEPTVNYDVLPLQDLPNFDLNFSLSDCTDSADSCNDMIMGD